MSGDRHSVANLPGQPGPSEATVSVDRVAPASVLAVGAHPDDVDFGCGATLAKWAAAGTTVHIVVCTDGSKGSWDADAGLAELVERRVGEQIEAARRIAGDRLGEVVFLGRVDGELTDDVETRRRLVGIIRSLRPEIVLGHDPWKHYRLHPDHRAAGQLLCDAVVAARDPHFFPGDRPHRPQAILLWEAEVVHHLELIEDWLATKIHALDAHRSQHVSTMGMSGPDDEVGRRRFVDDLRRRHQAIGAAHGYGAAEAFAVIDDI